MQARAINANFLRATDYDVLNDSLEAKLGI
jgi:hypothetical protein